MTDGAASASMDLALECEDGRITGVRVVRPRPHIAPRLLVGRSPSDAAALARLVFALCPAAQSAAIVLAARAAGAGRIPDPDWEEVLLERVEALVRHVALEVCAHRPTGRDFTAARQAREAVTARDWQLLSGLAASAALAARRAGTALPADPALRHPATQVVGALDPGAAMEKLWQDPGFAARPELGGQPAEVGPLALTGAPESPSASARLEAMGALLETWHTALQSSGTRAAAARQGLATAADGTSGAACIATSRGPLVMAIRLDPASGRIAAGGSVAPTEWNLHPDGALADAVTGLAADGAALATARRVIMSLDPCVDVRVTLQANE
jgi:uptake hydrogenase large subunit